MIIFTLEYFDFVNFIKMIHHLSFPNNLVDQYLSLNQD